LGTEDALTAAIRAARLRWLSPDEKATFEERAAIIEFCGGLSREEAERLAAEEAQR